MAELEIIVYPDSPPTHYHLLDLSVVEDRNLSLQAIGLHTYLVSRPPGWKIWEKVLISSFKNGRDSIRSCMKELEKAGYIEKEQLRDRGKFSRVKLRIHRRLENRRRENRRRKTRQYNNKQFNNKQSKDVSKETSVGFLQKPFDSKTPSLLKVKIKRKRLNGNKNGLLYNSSSTFGSKRANLNGWNHYDLDISKDSQKNIAKLKDKIVNMRINKPLIDETNEVLNYWNESASLLSNNGHKLTTHYTDKDTKTYYMHRVIVTGMIEIQKLSVEDLKKAIDNWVWILQNSWYGGKHGRKYKELWKLYGNQKLFNDCIENNVKDNEKYTGYRKEQRILNIDELEEKIRKFHWNRHRENMDNMTWETFYLPMIDSGKVKSEKDFYKYT